MPVRSADEAAGTRDGRSSGRLRSAGPPYEIRASGAARLCCTAHIDVLAHRTIFAVFCARRDAPENSRSHLNLKGLRRPSATAPSLRNCLREANVAGADPIVSGMAGRYATALFELARDEKVIDAVNADLERFEAMVADSADLARLVRSP